MNRNILALTIASFASTFLINTAARADDNAPPAQPPAVAPTTQPADIAALIRQLGDDDFHIRQDATEKLKAMGKAAITALQEARKSPDSEIHSRADQILQDIDRPPALPLPKPTGNNTHSTRMSVGGGEKTIDVRDPGRTIHIEETAAGIVMKVTGKIDGKDVTRDFKVKNADELKKQNPEAYALYQQYAGNNGAFGQIQIHGAGGVVIHGNINIQGGGVLINPNGIQQLPPPAIKPLVPVNPPGDDLSNLESRILEQMKAGNIPDDQRKQVKDLFKQMRDALPQADKPDKDVNAQMRDYNHQADALRQKLADLKLPDPGNALPPPASGRLGISATEETVPGQGLIVSHILPDSRAEKIGLKEQDVIQKVNGQEIHSTAELRKLVTENPKGLLIECLRDGKPLKLQEPSPAGANGKWYK